MCTIDRGDSCHPMLPYLAQGANSAVEDGAVLGQLLGHVKGRDQVPQALRLYEKLRKARGDAIVRETFKQVSQCEEAPKHSSILCRKEIDTFQAARLPHARRPRTRGSRFVISLFLGQRVERTVPEQMDMPRSPAMVVWLRRIQGSGGCCEGGAIPMTSFS